MPEEALDVTPASKAICLSHDVGSLDRALGSHPTPFESEVLSLLEAVTQQERELGLPGTYMTPAPVFREVENLITDERRSLAFGGSQTIGTDLGSELRRCRDTNQRTKGYRLLQGCDPDPLEHFELCYHKFDWVLGGSRRVPTLENGIVKIPVSISDEGVTPSNFDDWGDSVIRRTEQEESAMLFLGVNWWRIRETSRRSFLGKIMSKGDLRTCDELADEVILSRAYHKTDDGYTCAQIVAAWWPDYTKVRTNSTPWVRMESDQLQSAPRNTFAARPGPRVWPQALSGGIPDMPNEPNAMLSVYLHNVIFPQSNVATTSSTASALSPPRR